MSDSETLVLRMLKSMLTTLESIEFKMGSEATSHVQVSTSTRGYDITVKSYVGSDVRQAGDAAIDEYLRVRAELERRLMGQAA